MTMNLYVLVAIGNFDKPSIGKQLGLSPRLDPTVDTNNANVDVGPPVVVQAAQAQKKESHENIARIAKRYLDDNMQQAWINPRLISMFRGEVSGVTGFLRRPIRVLKLTRPRYATDALHLCDRGCTLNQRDLRSFHIIPAGFISMTGRSKDRLPGVTRSSVR
uniref:Uncharacterized protein n=1 Tax=Vespula pensylvanica TaxID=30213 RepID=A0A834UBQ2_VESPE|nr:hypothetical protein H0235_005547 [Vespula pensylvanica]